MGKISWDGRQSGAVVFKIVGGKIFILVISNRNGNKWIIPKGFDEHGLEPCESALKEVFEEAGVNGRIFTPALGKYTIKKNGGLYRVRVFLLAVKEELANWPEKLIRHKTWVEIDNVDKYIKNKKLLKIINRVRFILGSGEIDEDVIPSRIIQCVNNYDNGVK